MHASVEEVDADEGVAIMRSSVGRSAPALTAALALGLGLTACGGGDGEDGSGATSLPESSSSEPAGTTDTEATSTDPVETSDEETSSGTDGGSVSDQECDGLSAAEVSAATGVTFDAVSDVSVDTDVSCLFGATAQVYGVTVLRESADTFLAGEVAGLSAAEAIATIEQLHTMTLTDAQVSPITVAGVEGVLVTGAALTGGTSATASALVDGVVIEVSASGEALGDVGAAATAVLELAAAG